MPTGSDTEGKTEELDGFERDKLVREIARIERDVVRPVVNTLKSAEEAVKPVAEDVKAELKDLEREHRDDLKKVAAEAGRAKVKFKKFGKKLGL